jgi:spermidine/putrescine transport system substrate-binding protein
MNIFKTCFLLLLTSLSFFVHGAEKVIVYNWSEYIPEQLLKQFTQETGIEVEYSVYESNEAMYAKIKLLGGTGYDVIESYRQNQNR